MENTDHFFIERAIELARSAMHANLGGPFGAIIVKDGHIIGEGVNTVTSSNDPTAHAEVNAIRNACKNAGTFNLENTTIYTSCEPCPMCLGAIYWARIGHVVFASNRLDAARASFDDRVFYQEISLPWEERQVTFDQISRDAGQQLFKEWNAKQDKIGY
ncbi:MAG: nucleoside deaminase [Bacteroidetes bacterium]|nr:nucleoside deaminase [Bacteroidota bacterium]